MQYAIFQVVRKVQKGVTQDQDNLNKNWKVLSRMQRSVLSISSPTFYDPHPASP